MYWMLWGSLSGVCGVPLHLLTMQREFLQAVLEVPRQIASALLLAHWYSPSLAPFLRTPSIFVVDLTLRGHCCLGHRIVFWNTVRKSIGTSLNLICMSSSSGGFNWRGVKVRRTFRAMQEKESPSFVPHLLSSGPQTWADGKMVPLWENDTV